MKSFWSRCWRCLLHWPGHSWTTVWVGMFPRVCRLVECRFLWWSWAGWNRGWFVGRLLFFGWFWSGWGDGYFEDVGVVWLVGESEGFAEGFCFERVGDIGLYIDIGCTSLHDQIININLLSFLKNHSTQYLFNPSPSYFYYPHKFHILSIIASPYNKY